MRSLLAVSQGGEKLVRAMHANLQLCLSLSKGKTKTWLWLAACFPDWHAWLWLTPTSGPETLSENDFNTYQHFEITIDTG